ncbi:MAG: toll/interleukin-1 receptor domain-containing protein, partial [Gammaproteobacteria bacterium]|nr:toll/interleukin-1 receptor domain-containing protein [Gammaproteobacteria bacterium]
MAKKKRVERSVFLSYRRTNPGWALAIWQNLTEHGFDVFFDYEGLTSGDFSQQILDNIRARAHFIVLLTPSALERCKNPSDWLRQEIETALESRRNIIPLTLEGFDFADPSVGRQLTGKLEFLKHYNALSVPVGYFSDAMMKLREKYLNVPLEAVLH